MYAHVRLFFIFLLFNLLCIDLYFYVLWTDEDLKDVLSAKKMVIDGDANVEEVPIGSMQQFIFDGDGKSYPAR